MAKLLRNLLLFGWFWRFVLVLCYKAGRNKGCGSGSVFRIMSDPELSQLKPNPQPCWMDTHEHPSSSIKLPDVRLYCACGHFPVFFLACFAAWLKKNKKWLFIIIEIEGERGKVVGLKHYLGVWQHSVPPEICPTRNPSHQECAMPHSSFCWGSNISVDPH